MRQSTWLVFLVTTHLALFSFVVLRPLMLDIMAGMDQKDSFMRCWWLCDVVWWCKFLFWLCLWFCMGQRYADEGKIHRQLHPVPLTLSVSPCRVMVDVSLLLVHTILFGLRCR